MKTIPTFRYLPPFGFSRPIPLERFLPSCPVGVIHQYLEEFPSENGCILDPFDSHPLLDIEAAASGRRVLVAGNNPILAFTLRMLAAPKTKNEYLSALAEFASLYRGEERLETHLRALYQTRCVICHSVIQAGGYLWQRSQDNPYARVYRCPNCGDEGERAITEEDLAILQPLQRGERIHHARAIRQVLANEEERPAVEEALKCYNPRAIYVLFTLLNKLEGMDWPASKRELVEALMISALESGTSLWPWPNNLDTPRQLTVPAVYLEKNIWTELEKSIDLWSQPTQPVSVSDWPEVPESPGITLYPGPIRNLTLPAGMEIDRILCLPPRPNQALWTLSALWSGWIWGREAETGFSQVLGRRRFDWHWHTLAMHQALEKAGQMAGMQKEALILIGEPSASMVLATCAAAHCANFNLTGIAVQSPDDPIQSRWRLVSADKLPVLDNPQTIARKAIQDLLTERGEAVEYLTLYTAVVASLSINDAIPRKMDQFSQEKSAELQGIIARLFADHDFLKRFDATSQELDSGKWGLVRPPVGQVPLADRIEMEIVKCLKKNEKISPRDLNDLLGESFRGFLTPPAKLVEACLQSYADWNDPAQVWVLREQESGSKRDNEVRKIGELLHNLGAKLGLANEGENPLLWKQGEVPVCRFYISALAQAADFYNATDENETPNILVLPGSRAALMKYKLVNDPQLREGTAYQWHFLKFRSLRNIAARSEMSLEIWEMLVDSDPINLEETTQLRMFG